MATGLSSRPGRRRGLSSRLQSYFNDYSSSDSDTEYSDSDNDSVFSIISDSSDGDTDSDSGGDSSSFSDGSYSASVDISEHSNWSDNNAFVVRLFILLVFFFVQIVRYTEATNNAMGPARPCPGAHAHRGHSQLKDIVKDD